MGAVGRELREAADAPSRRRTGNGRWLYLAAWLPCLAIYLAAFITNGVPLGLAVRNAFANILPEVFLGLLVIRLPHWRPWPGAVHARFFVLQVALLLAFIVASAAVWAALVGLDALAFEGAFRVHIDARVVPWRVLSDLLTYSALAGLAYAWHNAAATREQAGRAARAEALRARAELEAMRSQLNPHFILNTFHALLGLVRRDPAVAEEALERLGDLLRHSLRIQREGVDELTLREEWTFVSAYLDLERLRLGDRLRLRCDAEPDAMDCLVPSFAVQTLVENAIRHAIATRAAGGQLDVRARRLEGRLRIEVEDDGPGMPDGPPADGDGVGLRLLEQRLAALYTGEASLELSGAAGGVCAVLELPARHQRETS